MWIDALNIKVGKGLSSIFALGGASTLAFTLALQDLAKKSLNGLSLAASDVFNVGDYVSLQNGKNFSTSNCLEDCLAHGSFVYFKIDTALIH